VSPRVLIIDDERNIRRTFAMVLTAEGFTVDVAESGEDGLERCQAERPDVAVIDVRLPGMDGIEVLRRLREHDTELPVIMISGHGTIATAVEATRHGAFDFIEKPLSKERLLVAIRNALDRRDLGREVRALRDKVKRRALMVGESMPVQAIREQVRRVGPTGARVLITGESGTGKELVARAVHDASDRRAKPFVKVNCAAIPEELIESELFGAVKGAYTGATQTRDGKFLQADGGTLFLDEIGDMSLKAQAKVLRALQEGEIERVGGNETHKVDVRVVAATNKDLAAEVAAGRFREDLYFRLNVVPVHMPPLRERPGDITLLAEHFLAAYLDENGLPQRRLSDSALFALQRLAVAGQHPRAGQRRRAPGHPQQRRGHHPRRPGGLWRGRGDGNSGACRGALHGHGDGPVRPGCGARRRRPGRGTPAVREEPHRCGPEAGRRQCLGRVAPARPGPHEPAQEDPAVRTGLRARG
jgi:two-component system nitrogen regulation response regulator NtrX